MVVQGPTCQFLPLSVPWVSIYAFSYMQTPNDFGGGVNATITVDTTSTAAYAVPGGQWLFTCVGDDYKVGFLIPPSTF